MSEQTESNSFTIELIPHSGVPLKNDVSPIHPSEETQVTQENTNSVEFDPKNPPKIELMNTDNDEIKVDEIKVDTPATGGYFGGNIIAMSRQINGQLASIIEAAFILVLVVLIYYLYKGFALSDHMKIAACIVGGLYFVNELLVYTGKPGGLYSAF